jgi:hypothetical protein
VLGDAPQQDQRVGRFERGDQEHAQHLLVAHLSPGARRGIQEWGSLQLRGPGRGLLAPALVRVPLIYLLPGPGDGRPEHRALRRTFAALIAWNVWYVSRRPAG